LMSGIWKRRHGELVRHRQPKGSETCYDSAYIHRARSRLYNLEAVLVLVLVVVLDLDLWTRRATRVDFPAINLFAQCHGGLGALVADLPVLFNEVPYRSGVDPRKWYQRASGICSCSSERRGENLEKDLHRRSRRSQRGEAATTKEATSR
jgi:hypothetical protein